jgi:N-methylhydantoinase B
MASPGGGGYGQPNERERSLIERDLELGYVSADAARRDYGEVLGTERRRDPKGVTDDR